MIRDKGMNWMHILDDNTINNLYQLRRYLTFFVIDKEGRLVYEAPELIDDDLDRLKKALADNAGT